MVTAAGTCIVCCSLEGFRERVSAPSSRGGGDLNGCLRALMRARKSHRFLRISRNGSKSPDKYDSPLPLTFFSPSVPTVAMQIEAAPRPLFDSTVWCVGYKNGSGSLQLYIYLMAPQLFRKCLGLPPIMKDWWTTGPGQQQQSPHFIIDDLIFVRWTGPEKWNNK